MTVWRQILPVRVVDPGPNPSDGYGIRLLIRDTHVAPTDRANYAGTLTLSDTSATPTDALTINIGKILDLANPPTDTRTSTGYFWLSGTTGSANNTTNPANANSTPDGAVATAKTAALGAAVAALTSAVGINIPTNTPVNSAIYRGWFSYTTTAASTSRTILRSTSALFADIVMQVSTTAFNFSDGSFTFNIFAAGVNTLAKLRSCQVIHQVTDTIAGAGGTLSVDAGRIELTNII
jgi:hypothetical protein